MPGFTIWSDFYSTEILWQSYSQWFNENRPYDRKSRSQMGEFPKKMYQSSRPRLTGVPLYEADTVDRENPEDAIVRADHQTGYLVGPLNDARDRFIELTGLGGEWNLKDAPS